MSEFSTMMIAIILYAFTMHSCMGTSDVRITNIEDIKCNCEASQ